MNRVAAPRSILDRLAVLPIAAAWLAPNHYPPWNSFHNEAAMAIGLLLLAVATGSNKTIIRLPLVAWTILLTAALPLLQWTGGLIKFSGDAVVSGLYLLGFAAAIGTGFIHTRTGRRDFAALLVSAALAAGLISSVLAMVQALQIDDGALWLVIPPGRRATGNLAQPNNFGTLLGFAALALWLLYEQRRVGSAAACAILMPLLIAAALAQSRTIWLFGPAVCLVRRVTRRGQIMWRIGWPALICIFALQIASSLLWPRLSAALGIGLDMFSDLTLRGAIPTGRTIVWPVLIDGALQSPWFGYGWLQTGAAQLAVAERHPVGEELFMHAHNIFLDLVIWCGLPLGLILSGLLIYWFVSRVRTVASHEAAIGLMVVAVFGVHAMLELPHHYAYFLIPVGLWVGLIEAERGSRAVGPRWAAPLLVAGTTALAVAVAWDYPAVEEDFRLVRFENLSIGTLRASQPAPDAPMLSSLTAYLRFMRLPITPGMPATELTQMDAVAKRYPYSTVLCRYAKALALNGRQPEALLYFDKLRHIHGEPRYQSLRSALHQEMVDGQPGLAALDAALLR